MRPRHCRLLAGVFALILIGGAASSVHAQVQPADAPVVATLTVLNRAVVVFRAPLLGIPPAERAVAAEQRILGQLREGAAGMVTTVTEGDKIAVQLDGKLAFVVTPGDANPLLEETQADVARKAVRALEQVAREWHEANDATMRWRAAAIAILTLAVWLAIVMGLTRLRRVVSDAVQGAAESRARQITVGGAEVFTGHTARVLAGWIMVVIYWTVVLLASHQALGLILRGFPYTRPWGEDLNAFLIALLRRILVGAADTAPNLLVIAVIAVIARFFVGVSEAFFDRVDQRKTSVRWLDADLAKPTQRIATIVIWLFALALSYPFLPGSESDAFKGLSVLVGLMVSLGGASSVAQGLSGLVIMYSRTFKVGDYVRIDDVEGTVIAINTVQTRLRTGMGQEIVLPNSRVTSAVVCNYSALADGGGFIVDATVTIGYDAPWRQVHDLLIQGARATSGVSTTPEPRVFQTALSDFYVEYRLVCRSSASEPRPRAEVMSDLHANIQDAFNAAGVQIMSPHYFADPAEPKVVPRDRWSPAPRR